jgi:hypothetical protein
VTKNSKKEKKKNRFLLPFEKELPSCEKSSQKRHSYVTSRVKP